MITPVPDTLEKHGIRLSHTRNSPASFLRTIWTVDIHGTPRPRFLNGNATIRLLALPVYVP